MNAVLPDASTQHLRALVAARTMADRESISLESISTEEVALAPPRADDVAGRVEEVLGTAMELVPDEMGDPVEFHRALDVLLRFAHGTARKLDEDSAAPLTPIDAIVLEAVIRTDGTRPSLLVRDGAVDPEHPLAGTWRDTLAATQETMRAGVEAVGRVEPANATARSFFGTAWVVDAGAGLALTNLHVEPTDGGATDLPANIPVLADPDGPMGNLASFCVVGFPGAPRYYPGCEVPTRWERELWGEDRPQPEDVRAEDVGDALREWAADHGKVLLEDEVQSLAANVIAKAEWAGQDTPRLVRIHDQMKATLLRLGGGRAGAARELQPRPGSGGPRPRSGGQPSTTSSRTWRGPHTACCALDGRATPVPSAPVGCSRIASWWSPRSPSRCEQA